MHYAMFALLSAATPVPPDLLYADGIETCRMHDEGDDDRLHECDERALGTDPLSKDTDGDGLHDGDEVFGTLGGLNLPAYGVNPRRKDLLLEYDWFEDANETGSVANSICTGLHSHRPTQAVMDRVAAAYAAAPVANPDGTTGIRVVQDAGQGGLLTGGTRIVDPDGNGNIVGNIFGAEAIAVYADNATPNRRGYFRHVFFAHRYVVGIQNSSSGNAAFDEPRAMVTLSCYEGTTNTSSTIVHELGHTFGLGHGGVGPAGTEACNQKPNYNSVMNYRFQFAGIDADCDAFGDGILSYSTGDRITLDENVLDERAGVCGIQAGESKDWNVSGTIEPVVSVDINNWGYSEAEQLGECGGLRTVLHDRDDWATVEFDRGIGLPGGGIGVPSASPPCAAPESVR